MHPFEKYYLPALLLLLTLLPTSCREGRSFAQSHSSTFSQADLQAYMTPIFGYWVDEGSYDVYQDIPSYLAFEPDLALEFRPEWVGDSLVKGIISEYCSQSSVAFLFFRYEVENACLSLVGAEREGCYVEIPRIDQLKIWYETTEEGTHLFYHAQEEDGSHEAWVRLKRIASEPTEAWACGLQMELIELLTTQSYRIYSVEHEPLTVAQAFGNSAVLEELIFWQDHQNFLPMYEEMCVRSPFPVVMIGGVHPKSQLQIYGINWSIEGIQLYETHFPPDDKGDFLTKGSLTYWIIPESVPLSEPLY